MTRDGEDRFDAGFFAAFVLTRAFREAGRLDEALVMGFRAVCFLAAFFFGAAFFFAGLRLAAFFFGAGAGAAGVIIDIMSAIILVSPV